VARTFLQRLDLDEREIALVESAILATRIPQSPSSIIEEVLCDADLLYLGTEDFYYWSNRLREELEFAHARQFTDGEWIRYNLQFMENHRFRTLHAQEHYAPAMLERLNELSRSVSRSTEK
jgi:hypothetical protein